MRPRDSDPGSLRGKGTDPVQTFYAADAEFTVSRKVAGVYDLPARLTPDEQRALLVDLNCDISYLNEPCDAVRARHTTQENDRV